jgi:hypothetical protein
MPLRSLVLVLIVLAFVLAALPAQAITYEYPPGCYFCEQQGQFVDDCTVPAQDSNGTGINCKIWTFFTQTKCLTSGGACMYSCTGDCGSGGGGGAGGGDGEGDCGGTYCPAQCFSCGGNYY